MRCETVLDVCLSLVVDGVQRGGGGAGDEHSRSRRHFPNQRAGPGPKRTEEGESGVHANGNLKTGLHCHDFVTTVVQPERLFRVVIVVELLLAS